MADAGSQGVGETTEWIIAIAVLAIILGGVLFLMFKGHIIDWFKNLPF